MVRCQNKPAVERGPTRNTRVLRDAGRWLRIVWPCVLLASASLARGAEAVNAGATSGAALLGTASQVAVKSDAGRTDPADSAPGKTRIRRNGEETGVAERQQSASPWSALAVLGVILVGATAILHLLRRFGPSQKSRPGSGAIEPLASHKLDDKTVVHLVRIGSRVLAIGASTAGLRTLSVFDDPEEILLLLPQASLSGGNETGVAGTSRLAAASADSGTSASVPPLRQLEAEGTTLKARFAATAGRARSGGGGVRHA